MDVLVRVNLPSGLSSSVSLKAGYSASCPPASDWVAALELRNPSVPFFPGDVLRIDFSVLNPPSTERLLAFRFVLQIRAGFQFIAFSTSGVPIKQEFTRGKLVVEGDMSALVHPLTGSLGQLVLQLDAHHTGTLRAVRLERDSFQFMIAQGSKKWFAVGVQAAGISCRRDGHLEVVVDHPRVTQLIVRARRTHLVHWRGVQEHAPAFSTGVDVLGVWNNFAFPTPLEEAVCKSSNPRVLRVFSCTDISPAGPGRAKVLISYVNTPGQSISIQVSVPSLVSADLGKSHRLRVQASLFGRVLDISPYVLGEDTPISPSGGVSLHADGMLECYPSFVGNYTVGKPVIYQGACLAQPLVWDAPRSSDTLFLFAGRWNQRGDFQLHPSMLSSSASKAGILFFRDGILQPAWKAWQAILENSDPSRAIVVEQHALQLVRQGQTPRCVSLGRYWHVPVVPPGPASLHVELTSQILVVQQDMWRLVPALSTLVSARLLFTDGSSMDVSDRLQWQVDPAFLEVVSGDRSGVKTRTQHGNTNVAFSLAAFPCVQASAQIQIFVSSVVTTTLVCQKCPNQLVTRTDPLSIHWPFQYPSAISANSFMVKRLLVDGSTHEQVDPLQVAGAGVLEGDQVVAVRSGELSISSAFARDPVIIPVLERWAKNYSIFCNSRACNALKLAPPDDGAGMPPFRYATRLEIAFELTMQDGSVSRFTWLPHATILANGNASTSLVTPSQGPLDVHVQFEPSWQFENPVTRFLLQVDTLSSLRLQVPPILYQLHCTRLWQRGSVSVMAVLTDGMEADVRAGLVVDGQILRLDPTHAFVEVDWPGEGYVNASFGGMHATATILASMENILFTSVSLDSVPEQWTASAGTRIPLHAMLSPLILIGSRKQSSYRLLLQRVIHWSVEPAAGIVDLDEEEGILTLLSDHYEPVRISALLRGCQMSTPISFSRSIQVNIAPDREGQVDLGADHGRPLPQTLFGETLEIPVFLFVSKPIQSYRAVLSLPGVTLDNCTVGELPFGKCSPSKNEVSASFPASQKTGRLWIGTFYGRVRLDNTLSRLSVSIQSSAGDSVSFFTVRLGKGRIQPAIPLANSFVAGLSEITQPETWPIPAPLQIQACCDLFAVGSGSLLTHLFPTRFSLQNLTVDLADPRIRVEYDDLVLRLDVSSVAGGLWMVERDAQEYMESTRIFIHYTHPDTLETLKTSISVTFAKESRLLLQPAETLVLSRIHCSVNTFQTRQVNASLLLRGGHTLELSGNDLTNATIFHEGVLASIQSRLTVTGLSTGRTNLTLYSLGMQATIEILVQTDSVLLKSIHLPDPYILLSPHGGKRFLALTGVLETGESLPSLTFLNPLVTTNGPVLYHAGSGSLIAQGNTNPIDHQTIQVNIPSCALSPTLQASSQLRVRLLANLTPRIPADVVIDDADSQGFNVTLATSSGVSAYLIHLQTDPSWTLQSCQPGQDQPAFSDCAPVPGGGIILVGAYNTKQQGNPVLARISPSFNQLLFGDIEYYAGISSQHLPIVAGRFGGAPALPSLTMSMPIADPAMLAKQYTLALQHPWDTQAMQDARFTLLLLADRQRVVDARVYSNENELSVMFRVTDRFLQPDLNRTFIQVLFHSRKLPFHPDATDLSSGKGIKVPAQHVVDGWYAVQWVGKIPRLSLKITYEVSTSTSLVPWEHSFPQPVPTGRPMHSCPRFATDQASFLVLYKLPQLQNQDDLARHIACSAQVAPRRVAITGLVASVGVESFIRMHQVHQILTNMDTVVATQEYKRRRLLQEPPMKTGIQRVGLLYINDTADPAIPCPPGTYFTSNGTYQPLPLHSVVGPDCYGMSCIDGYTLLGAACVPATVSIDLVWVCVIVILSVILLCICIICALHMGKRNKSLPPIEPVQLTNTTDSSFPDSTDPFIDEDDQDFKNIMLGSFHDDYSRTVLDMDPEIDYYSTPIPAKYRVESK